VSEEAVYPDAIDGTFVPLARRAVASVELEGEGLLYDEERGSWHLLSPTAMVIWQCCDGSGTLDELARDLAEAYRTDLETVRADTLDSVRQLGHDGLLEGVQGDEPELDTPHAHDHHHDHDHHNDEMDQPGTHQPGDGPRFLPVPPSG
jgi:hypothetical protein